MIRSRLSSRIGCLQKPYHSYARYRELFIELVAQGNCTMYIHTQRSRSLCFTAVSAWLSNIIRSWSERKPQKCISISNDNDLLLILSIASSSNHCFATYLISSEMAYHQWRYDLQVLSFVPDLYPRIGRYANKEPWRLVASKNSNPRIYVTIYKLFLPMPPHQLFRLHFLSISLFQTLSDFCLGHGKVEDQIRSSGDYQQTDK